MHIHIGLARCTRPNQLGLLICNKQADVLPSPERRITHTYDSYAWYATDIQWIQQQQQQQ